MVEKQSVNQPTDNIEVLQPISENYSCADSNEHRRENKVKTERVKAAFSVLDHLLNIYNSSETYIKRGITLFGLGSVIAGISFGAGQQINSTQSATSDQKVSSTPTVAPTPTPQPPSVIYLQVPTNHNSTNSTPVKVPTSAINQQQAVNPLPLETQSQSSNVAAISTPKTAPPQIESIIEKPPVEPVKPSSSNVKSIQNDIQEVEKVVEDVKEVADIAAPLKDLF